MKKTVALILAFIMIIMSGAVASADYKKLSRSEWDEIYNKYHYDNTLPLINVGADETEISLCWHADNSNAKAEVLVAKNADMNDSVLFEGEITASEKDEQVVCRVTVKGLEANTTYYYQWNTGDGWSDSYEYSTKSFGDHKALVIGDIQISEDTRTEGELQPDTGFNWNNTLVEALNKNPDVSYLVSPGDNTSTGSTAEEWATFLMPEAVRGLPMALAIGNHDKKGVMYEYYTNMPNQYAGKHFRGIDKDFWFRYGDVLYLVFNSTSGNAPDHMAMAKEAVEKNPDAKWRIGMVHHGIYGAGDAIGDTETELLLTTIFAPIFETMDLDFVITGHTHSQGRSHFMENGKIVGTAEGGKTYINPEGIVYLNSNSVCEPVVMDYEAYHLAYSFMENDVTTYSTLEFKGNQLILETRRGDNSELLDSLVIEKDIEFKENSFGNFIKRLLYKVVEFVGLIYVKIDYLSKGIS